MVGSPPLEAGPHKDFTLDGDTMQREFLAACDWDQQTCMPSRAKLEELGLEDVAQALHG
jgi:aldehyde:ferredoxin oxidoreductase